MADWKPPKFGSPVWIGINASDVERAGQFYRAVFNFPFKAASAGYKPSELMAFDFNPNGVNLSGGIQKVPESTGTLRTGSGGICVHWFVEDLGQTSDLIKKAGGKMLSEAEKEGKFGLYRYFEDVEGNVGAIYQMVSSAE